MCVLKKRVTAVHSHAGTKHTTRVAVTQRNSPLSLLSPFSLPFLFLPFPPFPFLSFLSHRSPNPPRQTRSAECDWGVGSHGFIQVQDVEEGIWEAELDKTVLAGVTIVGSVQRAARCPKLTFPLDMA